MMKRMVLFAALFCLLASPDVLAARKRRTRALNNLVSELRNVRKAALKGRKTVRFTNPRLGWCYFTVAGEATLRLNDEEGPLMKGDAAGESAEAMRHLPPGRHALHIEGEPSGLIVRAIPALQYAFYTAGDRWTLAHGPYDWEFLAKDVLPNVNVMISGAAGKPVHFEESKKAGLRWIGDGTGKAWYAREDHLKEWKGSGRSWFTTRINPFRRRNDVPPDEAYEFWAKGVGLHEPLMDGIIVDEFGGGDHPKYGGFSKAIEKLYANPKFKGKTYSPYSYGSGILSNDLSRDFARACIKGGGYLCIERYFVEQPTRQAAKAHIHEQFTSGWNMPRYEKDLPGVARRTVIVLGYMSAVGESLNVNPGVDFKVFMDMQMQALATEPSYAGLGGIQEYHAGYADEETVRWSGRLFRHYAIEGKTSLLSRKYGFKYALDHVRNPDFADGIKDWQVEAAEPGSMAPKKFAGYGYIQFRYSKKDGGDTFLWMKRNARKPNVFSQEIRNLKAGQLYSLKMVTGDYQDLVQGRMVKTQLAISLSIDNVEILPGEKSAFDRPFPQHYARGMGAFDGHKKNYWMNYHWRVFRTKGASATLTVSDWAGAKDPGGPAGQELVFNFIEVQPYLGD